MTRNRVLLGTAAVAVLVGVAGCGAAVTKSGAPAAASPTVLTLGTADPDDPALARFVTEVDHRSGHHLTIKVDPTTYYSETPGGEAKLASAVRAGTVPFAYIPSRDWAAVGDAGFRALQAPFVTTTTAQAAALVQGPAAGRLLTGLGAYGTVGLGLFPSEARRLLTRAPVLQASDLDGQAIRINDSDQTARLVSALGGKPVQGLTAHQTGAELTAGQLAGVESAPAFISSNSYQSAAPYLSSYGLFGKFEVLMANKAAWTGLTDAQRDTLQAAATAARTFSVTDVTTREQTELSTLCGHGLVLVQPAAAALAAITAAGRKATPTDAATVAAMQQLAPATPVPADPVPSGCSVATTAADARRLHAQVEQQVTAVRPADQPFPTGTFTVRVTAAQFAANGVTGPDWEKDITFTFRIGSDGTVNASQQPDYPDQGPASGVWKATGDQVTFTFQQGGEQFVETTSWSYYKGVLHLKVVSVQDAASRAIYEQPWHKVG
jgi:TRAP-type transport system periplasmic protein